MKHPTRSYCPSCDGFLQDEGEHFDGRRCGTCHGETLAAWWEVQPDGRAVLHVQAKGYVDVVAIRFGTRLEPKP